MIRRCEIVDLPAVELVIRVGGNVLELCTETAFESGNGRTGERLLLLWFLFLECGSDECCIDGILDGRVSIESNFDSGFRLDNRDARHEEGDPGDKLTKSTLFDLVFHAGKEPIRH